MKAINLGVEDGLPTVDWDGIAKKLEAGDGARLPMRTTPARPGSRRSTRTGART